jgi:hypothetical protein
MSMSNTTKRVKEIRRNLKANGLVHLGIHKLRYSGFAE